MRANQFHNATPPMTPHTHYSFSSRLSLSLPLSQSHQPIINRDYCKPSPSGISTTTMKKMTSFFLFVLLALFSIADHVSGGADGTTRKALGGGGRLGGWTPIGDTSDPHVLDLGKFAVSEHNKQVQQHAGAGGGGGSMLSFVRVVKGESQVVSGVNYRLVLQAKDHGRAATYEAVVWEKAWISFRKLVSFKPLS